MVTRAPMTEAERAAAGARMAAGREAAARRRTEDVAGSPTTEQLVMASAGATEITQEDVYALQNGDRRDAAPIAGQREADIRAATVTHTTAGKVRMYKPVDIDPRTGRPGRYTPRLIPNTAGAIQIAVRGGFFAACPDCNRRDCMANGDPNDCPGREPMQFRVCPHPVCHKRIYDPLPLGMAVGQTEPEQDPNEIRDDAFVDSTPARRTLAALGTHMLTIHPQEAPSYGFFPAVESRPPLQPQVGTLQGTR